MKPLLKSLSFLIILICLQSFGQSNDIPFYDYNEVELSSSAVMPGSEGKPNPITIQGKVFESDGVTPADGVIIYMYQHDENGDFQFEDENDDKRLLHRTWIKTDEEGNYSFKTFVPGEAIVPLNYPRHYGPKQYYLVAKSGDSEEYMLPAFMFEDDELIGKSCKRRLKRKGLDILLSPESKDGVVIAEKNIILPYSNSTK